MAIQIVQIYRMRNLPKRTIYDRMDPAHANVMRTIIGHGGQEFADGSPLPLFWHPAYFWDVLPAADLGSDGHEVCGRFIPDFGLPRRMWVGGSIVQLRPIDLGSPATLTLSVSRTQVRQGQHAFVELKQTIHQSGETVLIERKNLVYLALSDGRKGRVLAAPKKWMERRRQSFSPSTLFRYSAITFNSHRIHYDVDYCRDVEGYSGLVVHGPLLCTHILELARDMIGEVEKFSYRALAPVFCGEETWFCADRDHGRLNLWVAGEDGRLCMVARAQGA